MKKMNKLVSLMLTLAMCVSLAACGGPNKQPTVDAYNKAKDVFNEVSSIVNQDIGAYDEAFVNEMIGLADLLNEIKDKLNSNDLDQETLDNLTAWCGEVEQWAVNVKAVLEQ